jgi:hypothetical protein
MQLEKVKSLTICLKWIGFVRECVWELEFREFNGMKKKSHRDGALMGKEKIHLFEHQNHFPPLASDFSIRNLNKQTPLAPK